MMDRSKTYFWLLPFLLLSYPDASNAENIARSNTDVPLRTLRRDNKKTIMAWTTFQPESLQQLRNQTWSDLLDGIQAFCGLTFNPNGNLKVNETLWNTCAELRKVAKDADMEFYACIAGTVPRLDQAAIVRAIDFAQEYDLDGFSLDDESQCAPRSTLSQFSEWMSSVNLFAHHLHQHNLKLSIAVQAVFGIQNVPHNAPCDEQRPECSQACDRLPSQYPLQEDVIELLANSSVDRWLEMDTYYFSTGRFLGALDWYSHNLRRSSLGVGIENRQDITMDGWLTRFYAIDSSRVNWINIFRLPIQENLLQFLKRWKSSCDGCGIQSSLGCYDMNISCTDSPDLLQF